mgnify:CR=1 FL=1
MRTLVVDHPLVAHKLTVLRDENTDSPTFRSLTDELVTLLAYEATRDVRVEQTEIVTPVAPTTGIHLDNFQVTPSTYPRAADSKGSNTGDYEKWADVCSDGYVIVSRDGAGNGQDLYAGPWTTFRTVTWPPGGTASPPPDITPPGRTARRPPGCWRSWGRGRGAGSATALPKRWGSRWTARWRC